MYDELVKRLRHCSEEHSGCGTCELSDTCVLQTRLLLQAADAIDEMDTLLDGVSADNDALCETIERLKKPRWIPVAERLPEKNGYYLTYVESALFPDRYYQNLLKFIDGDFIEDHVVTHRITHWMPLPAQPENSMEWNMLNCCCCEPKEVT